MGSEILKTDSTKTSWAPSSSEIKPQVLLDGNTSYPREFQSLSLNSIKSNFHFLEENSTETKFLLLYWSFLKAMVSLINQYKINSV